MPDYVNQEELNRIQNLINNITQSLSSSNNNFDAIVQAQKEYAEVLKSTNRDVIKAIAEEINDSESILKQAIDSQLKSYDESAKRLKQAQDEEIDLKERQNAVINSLQQDENSNQKQYLQDKRDQINKEILLNEEKQRIEEAYLSGNNSRYQELLLAQELRLKSEQDYITAQKQFNENINQLKESFSKSALSFLDGMFNTLTSMFTEGVNRVTNAYNREAGNMAAALGSSVKQISDMQHNFANSLQSGGLNAAISNVAVLSEASGLVSSGYTNVDKLEQNALDIAIGKELAPNLDFNTNTIKNLTNIFGNDFTTRFSAIQQAVQETAGATIGLSETVNTLTTNLEPVYQNAEYSNLALQDTSDIAATLASARENNVITATQEKELLSDIAELMDPNKAFKSSNANVRVAATTYDYSSGSPYEAMMAILQAQEQFYNNFDQSNSYMGVVGRSLGAGVYGNDTFSAAYMPSGLTIDTLRTNNLGEEYNEAVSNLQAGNYTTAEERNQNLVENANTTQLVSDFAKTFPNLYKQTSALILGAINSLPSRINKSFTDDSGLFGSFKNLWKNRKSRQSVINGDVSDVVEDIVDDGSKVVGNNTMANLLGDGTTTGTSNNNLANNSVDIATTATTESKFGNFTKNVSKTVGGRTGGLAMASYGAGIIGAMNIGGDIISEGNVNAQSLGSNGDILSSATNWGGVGAAIGTLIAPGVGTAIGTFAGAAVGLATALWAQQEIEKENTAAMEELTQSTKDVLGEGVKAASAMEANAEIAKGGGTVQLNSGTYIMDMGVPKAATGIGYVPYDDYLVKLHKGESVVTASAAEQLRRNNPNFWHETTNTRNDDVVFELERQTQSLVSAIKGDTDVLPMQNQGPRTYTIRNATTT